MSEDALAAELERRIDWNEADKVAREIAANLGITLASARRYGYCITAQVEVGGGRSIGIELCLYGRRRVTMAVEHAQYRDDVPGVFDGKDKAALARAGAQAILRFARKLAQLH